MPRSSRRDIGYSSNNPIQEQAQVVLNAYTDPLLIEYRSRNNPNTRMGDPNELNIRNEMGGLYFVRIGDGVPTGRGDTAYSARGFTSFTGIDYGGIRSQDQFNRQFRFMGITIGQNLYSRDAPDSGAIAVAMSGSTTIPNISAPKFLPGDLVGFELPAIDPIRRAEQVRERSDGPEMPARDRHLAIPVRVTPDQLLDRFSYISQLLIHKNTADDAMSIPNYREDLRMHKTPSDHDDEACVVLKQFIMNAAFHSIMVCVQSGLLRPSIEVTTNAFVVSSRPSQSESAYAKWIGTIRDEIGELGKNMVDWDLRKLSPVAADPTSVAKVTPVTEAQKDALRVEMAELSRIFSTLLGLASDPSNPYLTEWPGFTQEILSRSLLASISTPATHLQIKTEIKRMFNQEGNFLTDVYNQALDVETIQSQISSISTSASTTFQTAIGQLYNEKMRSVIGTCSNQTTKGGKIFIVM